MTIGTFLDNCDADETLLHIIERGKGRVYDGTIYSFKTDDDPNGVKSKLTTKKIFLIGFNVDTKFGVSSHISVAPLVTIII